jgi:hypothetical protein
MSINELAEFVNKMKVKGYGEYTVVRSSMEALPDDRWSVEDSHINALFIDGNSKELRIFDTYTNTEQLDIFERLDLSDEINIEKE